MFENRKSAGEKLAIELQRFAGQSPVVYALPRGGLPVAAPVALALKAPLDLILVRKIGAPGHSELAIGAVVDGANPSLILHHEMINSLGVDNHYITEAELAALGEIERRRSKYFQNRSPISPANRTAILIDDGLATGATMEAAIKAVRKSNPSKVIVAIPTAAADTVAKLQKIADEVVCLETPVRFVAVGARYRNFPQLRDEDVIRILRKTDHLDNSGIEIENSVRRKA